MYNLCGLS